jgi:hypothetical protein
MAPLTATLRLATATSTEEASYTLGQSYADRIIIIIIAHYKNDGEECYWLRIQQQ